MLGQRFRRALNVVGFVLLALAGPVRGNQVVDREIFVQLPPPTKTLTWFEAPSSLELRGRNGERFTFICPPVGDEGIDRIYIYGSSIYVDDNPACLSAVHAGVITTTEGGRITIEIRPGQASYEGTTHNGITSHDYGKWHGSFVFVRTRRPATTEAQAAFPSSGGPALDPEIYVALPPPTPTITWFEAASTLGSRDHVGEQMTFVCPPLGSTSISRVYIYGSKPYVDDNPVCISALHAGALTTDGGRVTIEVMPGQESYQGTTQNGITSHDYGKWHGSYVVVGAGGAGGAGTATAATPPDEPAPPSAGSRPSDGTPALEPEIFVQLPPPTKTLTWFEAPSVLGLRGRDGELFTFICPSVDPASISRVYIYGSSPYVDDNPVCISAVHAGVISTADGGRVTIEIRPGQASYQGSTQNGITSHDYGKWHGSYVFVSSGGGPGSSAASGDSTDPGADRPRVALGTEKSHSLPPVRLPPIGAARREQGLRDLRASNGVFSEQMAASPSSRTVLSPLRVGYEPIKDTPAGCGYLTVAFDVEGIGNGLYWQLDLYIGGRYLSGRLPELVLRPEPLFEEDPIVIHLQDPTRSVKIPYPDLRPVEIRAELLYFDREAQRYDLVAVREAASDRPGPNLAFSAQFYDGPVGPNGVIPIRRVRAVLRNDGDSSTDGAVMFTTGALFKDGKDSYRDGLLTKTPLAYRLRKIVPAIPAGGAEFLDLEDQGSVAANADWSTWWAEIEDLGCSNERDMRDNFRHASQVRSPLGGPAPGN